MTTNIKKVNARTWAVFVDDKERARFSGGTSEANRIAAQDWAKLAGLTPTITIDAMKEALESFLSAGSINRPYPDYLLESVAKAKAALKLAKGKTSSSGSGCGQRATDFYNAVMNEVTKRIIKPITTIKAGDRIEYDGRLMHVHAIGDDQTFVGKERLVASMVRDNGKVSKFNSVLPIGLCKKVSKEAA